MKRAIFCQPQKQSVASGIHFPGWAQTNPQIKIRKYVAVQRIQMNFEFTLNTCEDFEFAAGHLTAFPICSLPRWINLVFPYQINRLVHLCQFNQILASHRKLCFIVGATLHGYGLILSSCIGFQYKQVSSENGDIASYEVWHIPEAWRINLLEYGFVLLLRQGQFIRYEIELLTCWNKFLFINTVVIINIQELRIPFYHRIQIFFNPFFFAGRINGIPPV